MALTTAYSEVSFLKEMSPDSRLWIYQNPAPIENRVQEAMVPRIEEFCAGWTSHQQPLETGGGVWMDRFVLLAVDESKAGASGCSIDSSVAFIRSLNAQFGLNLFERMAFTYLDKAGSIHTVDANAFREAYAQGKIGPDTLVADTLVNSLAALNAEFWKPLKNSWHARMV